MLGGVYLWRPPCLLPARHGLRPPLPTRLIMRKSLIQHLEQRGVQVRLEGPDLSKWGVTARPQFCRRLTAHLKS